MANGRREFELNGVHLAPGSFEGWGMKLHDRLVELNHSQRSRISTYIPAPSIVQ